MKNNIIANAFSLQMLTLTKPMQVTVEPVTNDEVKTAIAGGFTSAVGHADTAAVLSNMLGTEVACNRVSVKLDADTVLYVAQVIGGRLPEGSTTLPDGITIQWVRVTVR